jgi:predicted Zn-dependent protease
MLLRVSATLLITLAIIPAGAARADEASDCVRAKDAEGSIRACTELIRQQPTNSVAYNHRGNGYRAAGQYDQAIADHKAIQLDRPSPCLQQPLQQFHVEATMVAIAIGKTSSLKPKYAAAY